jgi:LPS sulfotransferase NodH
MTCWQHCCTPASCGRSYWSAEYPSLNHRREWGRPAGDLTCYVRAMWNKATTPNGMLGSKMMWNDFDWLRSSLHPPAGTDAGLEFMRTTFPDAQFVWLRRADKVRQGISW